MIKNQNSSPLFDLYWENTNLNDKNILNFVNNFINEEKDIGRIEYPTNDIKLDYPKDKLYEIMKNRESNRKYNNYQINNKQLSSLFSCFAEIVFISHINTSLIIIILTCFCSGCLSCRNNANYGIGFAAAVTYN